MRITKKSPRLAAGDKTGGRESAFARLPIASGFHSRDEPTRAGLGKIDAASRGRSASEGD